jgi:hypothetical protein
MANHEIRLIIAKFLFAFDLEICAESSDWNRQLTYMLWQKKPLLCKLRLVT